MASVNEVRIIGRLGRDPGVSYTQAGKAVAKLAVATSKKWKDKNTGEQREQTEWHRVVFFDKKAEAISQFFSKGKEIYVEGELKTSQYEKDGITRYSTEIVGNSFQFIGSKNDNEDQRQQSGQNQVSQQNQQGGGFQQSNSGQGVQTQQQQTGYQEDDLPF